MEFSNSQFLSLSCVVSLSSGVDVERENVEGREEIGRAHV